MAAVFSGPLLASVRKHAKCGHPGGMARLSNNGQTTKQMQLRY